MTKEEFVEKVKQLPGVGPKTAEKLYDAGFTTVEKLKAASVEELTKDNLVGKKTAEAILQGLEDLEAPAEAGQIQVREEATKEERRAKKEEKVEITEGPKVTLPKIKPVLTEELKEALAVRAFHYKRQPTFKRYHWWYKASLERNPAWRRPRGYLNKQRRGFNYRPPRVKVGYGKPAVTRGLHPSGFEEVAVFNVADLEKVDPKTQAARIGGTVGGRKRKEIEAMAAERKIRVLNPRRA